MKHLKYTTFYRFLCYWLIGLGITGIISTVTFLVIGTGTIALIINIALAAVMLGYAFMLLLFSFKIVECRAEMIIKRGILPKLTLDKYNLRIRIDSSSKNNNVIMAHDHRQGCDLTLLWCHNPKAIDAIMVKIRKPVEVLTQEEILMKKLNEKKMKMVASKLDKQD